MTPARPTNHLRPAPDNREQAVDLVRTGLIVTLPEFNSSYDREMQWAMRELETAKAGPHSMAASLALLFLDSMCAATAKILNGDSEGWHVARRALAAMYWGLEIGQHAWLEDAITYDKPTRAAKDSLSFHGLALAGGAPELAGWHAHFVRNLLVGGSVAAEVFEPDLIAFYDQLIEAHVTRRWPSARELSPELGAFRPLLEAAGHEDAFAAALVPYCDFRLSRAFQFEDSESRKPRKPNDPMRVFEVQWLAIFPFELFSLQGVYRAITGQELSLVADHPLLHTPIMNVPTLAPLAEDPFTERLQAYGKRRFGTRWQPLKPAPHGAS